MSKKRKIAFWICLAVFLAAVAFLISYCVSMKENEKIYDDLEKAATGDPSVSETVTPQTEIKQSPGDEQEKVEIPIDFETLWQTNRDIYAWLEIPGTKVNYPIVQSAEDNGYYLDHTVEGTKGLPGSIYTENINATDFSDGNTVIYGHNMKDGSMFGSLSDYLDETYAAEHQELLIYTPEHRYTYRIFAAVTYDNRHILQYYDGNDKMRLQAFLDSLTEDRISGWVNEEPQVTGDHRIVTLSTCNGNSEQRFLVEAVLTNEE